MVATRLGEGVQGLEPPGTTTNLLLGVQGNPSGLAIPTTVGGTVDVSDRAARLVGVVDTELPAAVALSDALGNPTTPMIGGSALIWDGTNWVRVRGNSTNGMRVEPRAAIASVTQIGAANAVTTLTIGVAGGQFHYITHIHIKRIATALLAGGAVLTVTTTNMGGRSWLTSNQASITVSPNDTMLLIDAEYSHAIKTDASGTATTIVCPAAGAAVQWAIQVDYYIGP